MSIDRQLTNLNSFLTEQHKKVLLIEKQRNDIESNYIKKAESIKKKWKEELDKKNQIKEDILTYYKIAKNSSTKDIIRGGVIPREPDFKRLNFLVDMINTHSRNDKNADGVIEHVSEYLLYIENEISAILKKESQELDTVNNDKDKEIKKLSNNIKEIMRQCEEYLKGEEIKKIYSMQESIHRYYTISEKYFDEWNNNSKNTNSTKAEMVFLGYFYYPIDIPKKLCGLIKSSLGSYFDESIKSVFCPYGFSINSYETIDIEYTDENISVLKKGIQALILNIIRYYKLTELKVSILDYLNYNADILGPIYYTFFDIDNSFIDKVPYDSNVLKKSIDLMASYYRKVEKKIGSSTVYEYNKSHEPKERIPYRIFIIKYEENIYTGNHNEAEMLYLLNNAEKFGITIIRLKKKYEIQKQETFNEKEKIPVKKNSIQIVSDEDDLFYIRYKDKWRRFIWPSAPENIPTEFVSKIKKALIPIKIGTEYFKRYPMNVPEKSKKVRKSITIPFAINEDDKPITCSFENETFAAYIMGAAGSGKSTLLHTIISGLLMNYHPDEVELWLLDFKMVEFQRYIDHMPPHVKYVLLEKSEELVFDIIDKLTEILQNRKYVFAQNGWLKLPDVPVDTYMPAIFVIIDEFAQMSQILYETKGLGKELDYAQKLENLLALGRGLGFKFIFSSQTYTTGIRGLTDVACKQIQIRFAMKNNSDEIKETLNISSDEITPEVRVWIDSLPPHITLYKSRNKKDEVEIGRFKNMYTEKEDIQKMISKINFVYKPVEPGIITNNETYIQKNPVIVDGKKPKTFKSQKKIYQDYENNIDLSVLENSDIMMYAGTPCSFNLARPFVLSNKLRENILIVGGSKEHEVCIMLSLFNSYSIHTSPNKYPIDVWSDYRLPLYKKYKDSVFCKCNNVITELEEICSKIKEIKNKIISGDLNNCLIVLLGYENLASEMEILGEDTNSENAQMPHQEQDNESEDDLSTMIEKLKHVNDLSERKSKIDGFNSSINETNKTEKHESKEVGGVYDARDDLKWILDRAPRYGTHFILCFERSKDFINTKISEDSCQHRLLFSMSKDDSSTIAGNRKANELDAGVCLYTNGHDSFSFRPHIYKNVSFGNWFVDDNGDVFERVSI